MNRAFVDVHRGEVGAAIADAEESIGSDPRSRQRLRLDARRRDARNRAVGERRTREGDRAVRRRRRRGGDAAAAGRLASEVSRAPDALLAAARQVCGSRAHRGRTPQRSPPRQGSAWPRRGHSARPPPRHSTRAMRQRQRELALSSAAACDLAGAAVEAAVSRTLAGSALGSSRRGRARRGGAPARHRALDEAGATRYRLGGRARAAKARAMPYIGVADPAPPTRPASPRSRRASSSSHAWWSTARRTPRSRPRCSSARRPSRSHLRNIFRKLDVGSRVELARAVERADSAG